LSKLVNGDQQNYQESVSLAISCDNEGDAVLREDEDDPISVMDGLLLSSYEKVMYTFYILISQRFSYLYPPDTEDCTCC